MIDINRLLKKKGWTGDEVGKALILSLIDAYKQALEGKRKPKELFSSEQLSTMVSSLKDRYQITRYNRYIGLQNWTTQYQAVAHSYCQLMDGIIARYMLTLTNAEMADNVYRYIASLPAIMTQKQYDEIKAKGIEEQLAGDKGDDGIGFGIFGLINHTICHFVDQLEKAPEKPNPLKAIKEKYRKEPVVTERILSRFNKVMGYGYYELEDGRRSDQMSSEEWQDALATPAYKAARGSGELSPTAIERSLIRAKRIFNGTTPEEAEEAEDELSNGLTLPTTWHYYEDVPEDLNKWDIIEGKELYEYYPVLEGKYSTDNPDEEHIEQVKAFREEFAELTDVIIAEINKHIGDKIESIPIEQWETHIYLWRDLYNSGFIGFREWIEQDSNIFKDKRALINGIAILRPSDILDRSPRIDENGYYIDPHKEQRNSLKLGLERYTPANSEYLEAIEKLETDRANLEEALYYVKGYNKAVDLVAEYIGIPEYTLFRADSEKYDERVDAINNFVALLYERIADLEYKDKDAQETNLQVLKDYFYPFKTKELTIPESAIEKARELLNDNMKAFEAQNGVFINLLAERGEEA